MKLYNLAYFVVSISSAYLPSSQSPRPQIQPMSQPQSQAQAQLPPQFNQPPVMSMQPHLMYGPMTGTSPAYANGPEALLTNVEFLNKMGNLAYGMGVKFAQGMESTHQGQNQIQADSPQTPQDNGSDNKDESVEESKSE